LRPFFASFAVKGLESGPAKAKALNRKVRKEGRKGRKEMSSLSHKTMRCTRC